MKKLFAKGLFIRNDDSGKPCCVGDTVKVSVTGGYITDYNDTPRPLDDKEWEGVLVLLKSKGIRVRTSFGEYVQPSLTKYSIRDWSWELIKQNSK